MLSNLIGQVLLNQYRVDAFVASGGMGAIYRVWDLKRNVPLAMKVLHSELAEDPSVFKSFQREARALQKLTHPNIVAFYGLYQASDVFCLFERFVDGPTLKQLLVQQPGRRLAVGEALIYLKALCAGLGYAHANGVVHCDMKPGNVMIDRGGNIYLADFGIARHAESTTTTLATVGTAAYMAPEQIRGEMVSPATDIYALGIMLFEMLTGQRPFRGNETGTEKGGITANERIRYAHINLQPPDPRTLNPDIPEQLAQVILKAMSKDPSSRFQNVQEMFLAAGQSAGVNPNMLPDRVRLPDMQAFQENEPLVPAGGVAASSQGGLSTPRRKVSLWIPIFMGVIAIILLAAVVAMSQNPPVMTPAVSASAVGNVHLVLSTPTHAVETELPTWTFTPDAPLIYTAAAEMVYEQLTETAVHALPSLTPTPSPTATPTLTPQGPQAGDTSVNSIDGATLIYIPPGSFKMGLTSNQAEYVYDLCTSSGSGCDLGFFYASTPQHIVQMDSFWIYRTEVSNALYAQCVNAGFCQLPRALNSKTRSDYYNNSAYSNYPVVFVDWFKADQYCRWAGGHLPTEAQWEYAARGDTGWLYPWGDNPPTAGMANVAGVVDDLTSVDSYADFASPFGVLNMAGNVWEWVADWWQEDYFSSQSDWFNPTGPSGPVGNGYRTGKGGSAFWSTGAASPGVHDYYEPDKDGYGVGFRCVSNP